MGHQVDLVTYPIGENKDIPGLRIFRSLRPPFVKSVKTGPSAAKIFLDFFLFFKAMGRLFRGKYQMIHTHEEANIMGAFFSKITGIPHLYDMHSSLVQQMNNFQFTRSRFIVWVFKFIERVSLKNAKSVIVICKSLFDHAAQITEKEKLTIIENFIDETPDKLDSQKAKQVAGEIDPGGKKIILYAGTLETYQGIPLLLDSMKLLDHQYKLVLIGGKEQQVEALRAQVQKEGLADKILLLGSKQPQDIPYYLDAADVLVSPRILGTNIPLKIYSYLKSGKPVVVTNLYTHTQSIDENIAILAEPEAEDFARGIRDAVGDKGKKAAQQAREFCDKNYSYERYLELITQALEKTGASL